MESWKLCKFIRRSNFTVPTVCVFMPLKFENLKLIIEIYLHAHIIYIAKRGIAGGSSFGVTAI